MTRGQMALGTFDWWARKAKEPEGSPTLRAYTERWLKSSLVMGLKAGTQEKYEECMRVHWFPALGSTRLQDLTRDQIKQVLEDKSAGYSKSLLSLAVDVLRACLNAAVEDKLILVNPAACLGRFIGGRGRASITVFQPKELAHILTTCRSRLPHIYPTVLILARTGMCLGEALSLQVGDLDLPNHRGWVRRTWGSRRAALGRARIAPPKSGKERYVDLSDHLTRVLRDYLRRRKRRPTAWLFPPSATDLPWLPETFRHQWKRLLKEAKIPYQHPHVLRHTYASILLQSGESPEYVMRQLGHASIKITVDTYGHFIPSIDRRPVNKLDRIGK